MHLYSSITGASACMPSPSPSPLSPLPPLLLLPLPPCKYIIHTLFYFKIIRSVDQVVTVLSHVLYYYICSTKTSRVVYILFSALFLYVYVCPVIILSNLFIFYSFISIVRQKKASHHYLYNYRNCQRHHNYLPHIYFFIIIIELEVVGFKL